jgi:hypothetical protein
MKKLVASALAAGLLSACGGGGGGGVPNAPASSEPAARTAAVTFTIELPAPAAASSAERKPSYVSPSTLSAVVTLTAHNGAPAAGPPYAVNIGYRNGCTGLAVPGALSRQAADAPRAPSARAATCSFSIPALVGTDTFAVALYDAAQTSATPSTLAGNVLSLGTSAPSAVVENTANVVPITLNGVVAFLQLTLSPLGGVAAGTDTPLILTVSAQDADHNFIRRPGSYSAPIVLTSDRPSFYTIVPASLTDPAGTATTTYPGSNFQEACTPVNFTATSGSVTATTALTIDPVSCQV